MDGVLRVYVWLLNIGAQRPCLHQDTVADLGACLPSRRYLVQVLSPAIFAFKWMMFCEFIGG